MTATVKSYENEMVCPHCGEKDKFEVNYPARGYHGEGQSYVSSLCTFGEEVEMKCPSCRKNLVASCHFIVKVRGSDSDYKEVIDFTKLQKSVRIKDLSIVSGIKVNKLAADKELRGVTHLKSGATIRYAPMNNVVYMFSYEEDNSDIPVWWWELKDNRCN